MRYALSCLVSAAALLLAACMPAVQPAATRPASPPADARQWTTTPDPSVRLAPVAVGPWQTARATAGGEVTISIDAGQRFQTITGFGAAITDSSAWLIQHRLSAGARDALTNELFGREANGLGLTATRVTIGASDFSREHYSLAEGPPGSPLAWARVEQDVLPTMRQARGINPDLFIIASPWSAPAAMKSGGSLIRGTLRTDAYPAFAAYLRDYLVGMAARGVPIDALTIQNEPHFEPTDYPGMRLDPAQRAAFVGHHLGPLLTRERIATQILEWDHNWDQPESPAAVLRDPVAARYISGVAWHCYAGDVSVQSQVRQQFPDKDVWFTECSGGGWAPDFGESLGWMMRNLIIGATRHWARGVVLWNMALDENSGPHLGGCGNCRGVVTIDSRTGAITRNVEYYALAHASRFVRPGAQRIGSDGMATGIDHVALRNADDGSRVTLIANAQAVPRRLVLREGGWQLAVDLPAHGVTTVVWR